MLFTADRIQSVVFVCVYLPGSSCYSSSHLCCGVCFLCTTFLLDCVLGELIWLENIPFSELLVILNWDKLDDPVHHMVWWRAALALLRQCCLGCSFLLPKVMAERNARDIGLSCFPCWCKSVRCDFFRKRRAWILLYCSPWYLHVLYSSSFPVSSPKQFGFLQDTLFGPPSLISNPDRYSKKRQTRYLGWISVFFWHLQGSLERQSRGI